MVARPLQQVLGDLTDEPVILVMAPYPHPDEVGAVFNSQSSVAQTNPCRPVLTNLFEV